MYQQPLNLTTANAKVTLVVPYITLAKDEVISLDGAAGPSLDSIDSSRISIWFGEGVAFHLGI